MLRKKILLYLVALSALIFSGCIISGIVVDKFGNGIEGVTVTLSGDASDQVITDSSGKYQFGEYPSAQLAVGTYTVTPSKAGYNFGPTTRSVEIIQGNDGEPSPVTNADFKDVTSTNYENTALLKGYWEFIYFIGDTRFTSNYRLDDIIESDTTPNEYHISGLDEYGKPVVATYSLDSNEWKLIDPGATDTSATRYFVFYTDGNVILENSCYYRLYAAGDQSRCYQLEGSKLASPSLMTFGNRSESLIDEEKIDVDIETVPFDDAIDNNYFQLKKFLDSQE